MGAFNYKKDDFERCTRSSCKLIHITTYTATGIFRKHYSSRGSSRPHRVRASRSNDLNKFGKRWRDEYSRKEKDKEGLHEENDTIKRKYIRRGLPVIALKEKIDKYDQSTCYRKNLKGKQTIPTLTYATDSFANSISYPPIDTLAIAMEDFKDKNDKDSCPNFERGVCNRGNECKYYNPSGISQPGTSGIELPACRYFQDNNKRCTRKSCKFLHITPQEEAIYKATGMLPENYSSRGSIIPHSVGKSKSNKSCKDFMNGVYQRGNCKFLDIPENQSHKSTNMTMHSKQTRDDYSRNERNMGDLHEGNETLKSKYIQRGLPPIDLGEINSVLYNQNTPYCNNLSGNQTEPTSAVCTDPYVDPYRVKTFV